MPRRRKAEDEGVSLFPFMSILACLIGILTLMISVSMAVNQKNQEGQTEEELQRAKENQKLKSQARKIEIDLAQIEKKAQKEAKTIIEMMKLKDRSIKLTTKLEGLKASSGESDAELQKLVENFQLETKTLKKEQPTLEKKIVELKAELAKLKTQPKPKESVVIQPGGVGTNIPRNLFFIECSSTGIVIRGKEESDQIKVTTAAINQNNEFASFCEKVKKTKDSMILCLVRKSGNEAYRWAAGIAESKFEVKTGKLPVPNEGKIDLKLFNSK